MTLDPILSTTTSIHISWTHLVQNLEIGASPILNYVIRTNQGSQVVVWQDLETIPAALPYEYTATGLTPGETYSLRVVAQNLHGLGPESEDLTALAAD